jgi:hypothetical protein
VNEAYPRISYTDGEYHIYKSACAGGCYSDHENAHRDGVADHSDSNADGLCDGCDAVVGEIKIEPPKGSTIGGVIAGATEGVKDIYHTAKEGISTFYDSALAGCSGSVGGSIGGLSALLVGGLLFRKKRDD